MSWGSSHAPPGAKKGLFRVRIPENRYLVFALFGIRQILRIPNNRSTLGRYFHSSIGFCPSSVCFYRFCSWFVSLTRPVLFAPRVYTFIFFLLFCFALMCGQLISYIVLRVTNLTKVTINTITLIDWLRSRFWAHFQRIWLILQRKSGSSIFENKKWDLNASECFEML